MWAERHFFFSLNQMAYEVTTGPVDWLCVLDEKRDWEIREQKMISISANTRKHKEVLDKVYTILLTNTLYCLT